METLKDIEIFGLPIANFTETIVTTESQEISRKADARIIVDDDSQILGVELTLKYTDNNDGVKVEIFAFRDLTVTYYTDSINTTQFSMVSGTSMQFIFHNGWKHNGIYDAVWN